MAVSMIGPKFYAWDRNGKPLAFGKLYTYQARTNTPKPTYQSEDQVVENTNPVILNGEGYANVYLDGSYKMVLKDDKDNEIWSSDPVSAAQPNEWVKCMTATYVSPNVFKISGNSSNDFEPGRRCRIDNNSTEYSYSTIKSSTFSAGETTVTLFDSVVTTGVVSACVSISGPESSGTIQYETLSEAISGSVSTQNITVRMFDSDSEITNAEYGKVEPSGSPSSGNAGKFTNSSGETYELLKNPTDKIFGCSPLREDSSQNYLSYLTYCWSSGRKGFTESDTLDFADGIEFQGGGSASNVIGFLSTEGSLKINLGPNATKTALTVNYVYYANLGKIEVDGNKGNQTIPLNGIVFQWIDTLIATDGSRGDNCYRNGVLLFKVKNVNWLGGGGSHNGGVDPDNVVSDGILALAVGSGTIGNVICHFNNPSTTQPGDHDGNGVQLGMSATEDAFWSNSDFRQLNVYGVDAIQNGRRGLKIQRGNVTSWGNKLSNNYSSNLAIVETQLLENIVVFGSKIGASGDTTYNTIKIGSSGGGVAQNIQIFGNTFLGSPDGQAIDIDLQADAVRMHSNIEQWSGGFADRYLVRAGVTDVQIETNKNINDQTSGEVTQVRPSELGDIQPGQIKQPGATKTLNLSSNEITVDDYTGAVNVSAASGTTDLNTINGGYPGQIITLRTNSSTGDVTVKSQVGNIYLAANADMPLGYPFDRLMLQYTDFGGTIVWVEVSRADNF